MLIENGKVCALNFPIGMNAGLAKAIGVMMKLDFERAVLKPVPDMEVHPDRHFRQVLFMCDEYQHFATVGESEPTGDEKFFSLSASRSAFQLSLPKASVLSSPLCPVNLGAHSCRLSARRYSSHSLMILRQDSERAVRTRR